MRLSYSAEKGINTKTGSNDFHGFTHTLSYKQESYLIPYLFNMVQSSRFKS